MTPPTVDEQINQALAPASKAFFNLVFVEVPVFGVGVPLVVIWLVGGAVFFTLTALVIGVATVTWPEFMDSGLKGVAMTSDAFGRTVWWFPYPLALAAVLFALSTMLSWSYYGMQGLTYLVGPFHGWQTAYKVAFCVFIVIGASIKLDAVLDFSDAMVFVLCVPNVLGLLILAPVVKEELQRLREHAAAPASVDR